MIRFKATPDQVKKIIANAVNLSDYASIDSAHRTPPTDIYTGNAFYLGPGGINIDIFGGRRVEIEIVPIENQIDGKHWKIAAGKSEPDIEFQTWADAYPTYRELVESVAGVQVIEENLEE